MKLKLNKTEENKFTLNKLALFYIQSFICAIEFLAFTFLFIAHNF